MKTAQRLVVLTVVLVVSGCGSAALTAAPPTPAAVPTQASATPMPAATVMPVLPQNRPAHSIDLGYGHWLTTKSFESQDQARNYSIKVQMPYIEGVSTPQIEQFNLAVQTLVTNTLNSFQQEITQPLLEQGGFIYVNYQVIGAANGLLSILFDVSTYTGGAHPNTTHIVLNYDLNKGQPLTLADVFKPNVDVVGTLAAIATDELTRTNRLLFPEGAQPKPENYKLWNFDFDNLLITFEQYQVMPYVYGPQTVAIPYWQLKDVLRPDSPLAEFWQLTNR